MTVLLAGIDSADNWSEWIAVVTTHDQLGGSKWRRHIGHRHWQCDDDVDTTWHQRVSSVTWQ